MATFSFRLLVAHLVLSIFRISAATGGALVSENGTSEFGFCKDAQVPGVSVTKSTGDDAELNRLNRTDVWRASLFKGAQNQRLQVLDSGNPATREEDDGNSGEYSQRSLLTRGYCDSYATCGPNGYCDITNVPSCRCLVGFEPTAREKWSLWDFSAGCNRTTPLTCQDKVGFARLTQTNFPSTNHSWINRTMSMEECSAECLRNCTCVAYATANISGVVGGCAMWSVELMDLKFIPNGGQDIYIRTLASELAQVGGGGSNNKLKIGVSVAAVFTFISVVFLVGFCIHRRRSRLKGHDIEEQNEDLELPLFDLPSISAATDNFSDNNKLGQGGFGAVYWGRLGDGEEVAVKRLAKESGQGLSEFKNEVSLIANLQHRNLVKLLGCCIQGEERMLIYEYMPNKSLDSFLFDKRRGKLLDWPRRFHIISGVAKGLVYLHQDSRLRIIHRDLKASNVLLDADMNPKISDFGIARTFHGDQMEANTTRVVGTYGYMAPEYAIDGQFSIKSDVFSYGILLLEIISGKKSKGSRSQNNDFNLIGYAWELWKDGNQVGLIDEAIRDSCNLSEALRCIHISLLCVQQRPDDRPSMPSVALMLSSDSVLHRPKQPGFFVVKKSGQADKDQSTSSNEVTITLMEAR